MQGVKAKLLVKPESKPKFFKPRQVPYALKGAIEQELDRLENIGVIEGALLRVGGTDSSCR